MKTQSNKSSYQTYSKALAYPDRDAFEAAVGGFFADDAVVNIVHPFNQVTGSEAYFADFLTSLMASFDGLYRRDYIMMGGGYDDGEWLSATGYYVGRFEKSWLGIRPTKAMAYLRFGEFHRFAEDASGNRKVVESYVYLDIPELMIAAGQWPAALESPATIKGYTGYLPGPASQDGLLIAQQDAAESAKSLQIVDDMLLGLATEDEQWRPYWHENMVWYGPAAFGSYLGIEEFQAFQVPFENKFSSWVGGSKPGSKTRHFCRFGEGAYTCSGGWPSLNAHQIKPFLGQPATNETLYMRVCDWWRRDGDLLVENWVFVDIPDVLLQMGYDLFAELQAENAIDGR